MLKFLAKPNEQCGNGERCVGGSQCDYTSKICKCPAGTVIRDDICIRHSVGMNFLINNFISYLIMIIAINKIYHENLLKIL